MKMIVGFMIMAAAAGCHKNSEEETVQTPDPSAPPVEKGVRLQADGPGDTYELIASVLGGNPMEDPDCAHPAFGRHVSEVFDPELNKNVFVFNIHVTPDNDRCNGLADRQRNEIKTYGPSPDNLKAQLNDTVVYRWKFRLDKGFQPSPNFTHIHQIKAGDGSNDGSPLITITPRYGNPDKLEIIHTGNGSTTTQGKIKTVDLAPFEGNWVEVTERLVYKTAGSYSITIKKITDGAVLLNYSNDHIDLWRDGASFCRPKWGIYRSLNSPSYLRDEEVRFADFCIAEGRAECE